MKKFAALLATALVMALSATSVFAAGSVSLNAKVEENVVVEETETTKVATFSSNTLGVTLDDVKEDATVGVKAAVPNVESADILGVAEVTYKGTVPAEGVAITLKVDGINAGDNVLVIHYTSATTYEVLEATAGAGTVTATFKSFSPVAIVKYTVPATTTPDDDTSDDVTEEAPAATPVAPKTGVLPVAAITAGICLAGAAVCGKKVKFN